MKRTIKATACVALVLMVGCVCVALTCGCSFLNTNDRSLVGDLTAKQTDNGIYFYLNEWGYCETLLYQADTRSLQLVDGESTVQPTRQIVLQGRTTAHDRVEAAEGYEQLMDKVLAFTIYGVEYPIYQTIAYKDGDEIYGFCNLYTRSGFFTDALDCRGIDRGVLFTYDERTDTLTVVDELYSCLVVAFDGKHVIWTADKTFYAKQLGSSAVVPICTDYAYDDGPSGYSNAVIYSGQGYCVIYFHVDKVYPLRPWKNIYYNAYVLVTMDGTPLATLGCEQ